MEPFASVEDLESRWRELDPDEEDCASVLLEDASSFLVSEFRRVGKKIDTDDEIVLSNLKRVCCSIVARSYPDDTDGISQFSQTAGPFSSSQTIANPARDMYLTKQERLTLGLPQRACRIGFILPAGYGEEHDERA